MSLESITKTIAQIVAGDAASAKASKNRGWIVGHFMPDGTLAHNTEMEIKLWHYDEDPNYGLKVFTGTEFIVVEKGTLLIELEIPSVIAGELPHKHGITLRGASREWAIIPPNCTKRAIVIQAPAWGVTVRWPSAPGVNKVLTKG